MVRGDERSRSAAVLVWLRHQRSCRSGPSADTMQLLSCRVLLRWSPTTASSQLAPQEAYSTSGHAALRR